MPDFRETRACFAYALIWEQLYNRTRICTFCTTVTSQQIQSFRLELRQVRFRREIKRRTNAMPTEFRFYRKDIYKLAEQLQLPDEITTYIGLLFIHTVLCFDRFQCWLNS